MTTKESVLEALAKQKNVDKSAEAIAIKTEWLLALKNLFDQITLWSKEAVDRKLLEIKEGQVAIQEERIGAYYAPSCEFITPAGIRVHILPKARFVVGSIGRVDWESPPNEVILVRKNGNNWQFAELDAPCGWRYTPLTEESFWEMLGNMIG